MPAKQAGSPHGAYCWCGGALAKHRAIVLTRRFFKIGQNLVNNRLIFDTAVRRIEDDLYGTPTVSTGFNINVA
jgi:hypothetical protein